LIDFARKKKGFARGWGRRKEEEKTSKNKQNDKQKKRTIFG